MMLNIAMNEYFQSVRKTKHSKLRVTRGGPTHLWNQPTDSPRQIGVQSLFTMGKSIGRSDDCRKRSQTRDATDEQSLRVEDDSRPVGRRSKRISPRRKAHVVTRW